MPSALMAFIAQCSTEIVQKVKENSIYSPVIIDQYFFFLWLYVYNVPQLTGNSSLPLQMPVTCLCCMTCLIFNNAGNAVHPALILQLNKALF